MRLRTGHKAPAGLQRARGSTNRLVSRRKRVVLSSKLVRCLVVLIPSTFLLYLLVGLTWHNDKASSTLMSPEHQLRRNSQATPKKDVVQQKPKPKKAARPKKKPPPETEDTDPTMRYEDWRALAVMMASLTSQEILEALDEMDPFGTRSFEKSLLQEESRLGRLLTMDEIKQLFPCPRHRLSLPDQRDTSKAEGFRSGNVGTFLFFQHLRKAGGTHFCSMARANLPRKAIPDYYCMPDMGWSDGKGAGYLHHYSNEEITRNMKKKGHRIAGNEWDNFDVDNHFGLQAVFATSFRRPLDRALSQFRFECIEDRGCKIKDVGKWWKKRIDLYNVFTCTFSDEGSCRKKIFEGSSEEDGKKRGELMGAALDTVAKFNLVMVMEWLAYAGPQVESVLGFHDTSVLTKRVRPHIAMAKRDDGQEENKLGAAGIAKASWVPKDYLTPEQYEEMSNSLALDEILTDAARRLFLERIACPVE